MISVIVARCAAVRQALNSYPAVPQLAVARAALDAVDAALAGGPGAPSVVELDGHALSCGQSRRVVVQAAGWVAYAAALAPSESASAIRALTKAELCLRAARGVDVRPAQALREVAA